MFQENSMSKVRLFAILEVCLLTRGKCFRCSTEVPTERKRPIDIKKGDSDREGCRLESCGGVSLGEKGRAAIIISKERRGQINSWREGGLKFTEE